MAETVFLFVKIEWFDWTSPNERCTITFPITRMTKDIVEDKLPVFATPVALNRRFAASALLDREPNLDYVARLTYEDCQAPVLFAKLGNSHILIDGTHRYLASVAHGLDSIPALILEEKDWLPYVTIKGNLADAYLDASGKPE